MDPEEPENPPEDYNAEEEKKKIETADPYEVRLKEITQDKWIEVGSGITREGSLNTQSPWVVKLMGDKSEYNDTMNPKKKVCFGVVVVRSLQWPGHFTFFS